MSGNRGKRRWKRKKWQNKYEHNARLTNGSRLAKKWYWPFGPSNKQTTIVSIRAGDSEYQAWKILTTTAFQRFQSNESNLKSTWRISSHCCWRLERALNGSHAHLVSCVGHVCTLCCSVDFTTKYRSKCKTTMLGCPVSQSVYISMFTISHPHAQRSLEAK